QTFTGTILGTVHDGSGAVAPNVKITIVETQTNVRRTSASDKDGHFEMPLLPPGTYQVEAELTGFKKFVRSELRLEISQKMEIPIVLEPASVSESIEVKGETPLLDTTSSSRSQDFDSKSISELPSSNRNFFQIAE